MQETFYISIFVCCYSNVAQDLSEAILTLVANAGVIMSKVRSAPPGVVGAKPPLGVIGLPGLSNPPPNTINPVSKLFGCYGIVDVSQGMSYSQTG